MPTHYYPTAEHPVNAAPLVSSCTLQRYFWFPGDELPNWTVGACPSARVQGWGSSVQPRDSYSLRRMAMYFTQTPALPLCPLPGAAGRDFPRDFSLGNGHPTSEHSTCQPIRSFYHPASVLKRVMRLTETGNFPPPPPPPRAQGYPPHVPPVHHSPTAPKN